MLEQRNLNRIHHYAKLTGKPVSDAVNEALNEWLELSGDLIITELERKRAAKPQPAAVICITERQTR
jgi:hypothetical protein